MDNFCISNRNQCYLDGGTTDGASKPSSAYGTKGKESRQTARAERKASQAQDISRSTPCALPFLSINGILSQRILAEHLQNLDLARYELRTARQRQMELIQLRERLLARMADSVS